MATKSFPFSDLRSKSLTKVISLFVFLFFFVIFFHLFFTSTSTTAFSSKNTASSFISSDPNYFFVSSLAQFLTTTSKPRVLTRSNDPKSAEELDRMVHKKGDRFGNEVLRVYVYEMPDKFTYGLLWLFHTTYKEAVNLTSNGSPVHRLIEQHSIYYWLWADLIAPESERLLKNVVRVQRQEEADLFYIPFFTTISFFLLEKQQCKALYRVCPYAPRKH